MRMTGHSWQGWQGWVWSGGWQDYRSRGNDWQGDRSRGTEWHDASSRGNEWQGDHGHERQDDRSRGPELALRTTELTAMSVLNGEIIGQLPPPD